jgi:hypothetical protein
MPNDDTAYAVPTATETPWQFSTEPQGEPVDLPNPPAFVEHAHKRARLVQPGDASVFFRPRKWSYWWHSRASGASLSRFDRRSVARREQYR